MHREFISNLDRIEKITAHLQIRKNSIIRTYNLFGEDLDSHDENELVWMIDSLFERFENLHLNFSVYKELINSDKLSLINDESCKQHITEFSWVLERAENYHLWAKSFQKDQLLGFTLNRYPWKNADDLYEEARDWSPRKSTLDYDIKDMFKSLKFENLVENQLWNLNTFEIYYDQVGEHASETIALIEQQLN